VSFRVRHNAPTISLMSASIPLNDDDDYSRQPVGGDTTVRPPYLISRLHALSPPLNASRVRASRADRTTHPAPSASSLYLPRTFRAVFLSADRGHNVERPENDPAARRRLRSVLLHFRRHRRHYYCRLDVLRCRQRVRRCYLDRQDVLVSTTTVAHSCCRCLLYYTAAHRRA